MMAVTIAPNPTRFGDGAPGIAFSPEEKWQRTTTIQTYLMAALAFAKQYHLPLADSYTPSLTKNGSGNLLYINNGDHIHYSPEGRALFAQTVVQTIIQKKLLE